MDARGGAHMVHAEVYCHGVCEVCAGEGPGCGCHYKGRACSVLFAGDVGVYDVTKLVGFERGSVGFARAEVCPGPSSDACGITRGVHPLYRVKVGVVWLGQDDAPPEFVGAVWVVSYYVDDVS